MRTVFTCKTKTFSFIAPIERFEGTKLISSTPRIRFRDHKCETEDAWEIKQIRKWAKKYPKDGIKEIK